MLKLDSLRYVIPGSFFWQDLWRTDVRARKYSLIINAYLKLLDISENETPEFRAHLRKMRLGKMIRLAKQSPFWKDRLGKIYSHSNLEEMLKEIPIVSKQTLRDVPLRQRATAYGDRMFDSLIWRRTSGSSGIPLTWACDPHSHYVDAAAYHLRILSRAGFDFSSQPDRFYCILNFNDTHNHRLSVFANDLKWLPLRADSKLLWEKTIQTISALKHPIIFTYPSDLSLFIQELSKHQIRLRIPFIVTTGQPLDDETRTFTEAYLDCEVYQYLIARETGPLAMECQRNKGWFHVNEERVIIEVVDELGRPAGIDQWGRFIVTVLDNFAMPMLRYDGGDIGRIVGRMCECGSSLQLIEFSGRGQEYILLPDGSKISAHEINSTLLSLFFNIYQYQIRQENEGLFIFIVPRETHLESALIQKLSDEVRRILDNKIPVFIKEIPKISHEPGEKIKRFVPLKQ